MSFSSLTVACNATSPPKFVVYKFGTNCLLFDSAQEPLGSENHNWLHAIISYGTHPVLKPFPLKLLDPVSLKPNSLIQFKQKFTLKYKKIKIVFAVQY